MPGSIFSAIDFARFDQIGYPIMILYALIVLVMGWGNWYSTMVALIALPMIVGFWYQRKKYSFVLVSFAISIIPFFMMNSALTGFFTPEPIVWYNNAENLGFRWGTIPVEDILYSFILVAGNILVFKTMLERESKKIQLA